VPTKADIAKINAAMAAYEAKAGGEGGATAARPSPVVIPPPPASKGTAPPKGEGAGKAEPSAKPPPLSPAKAGA
jgi:hypothetical protein